LAAGQVGIPVPEALPQRELTVLLCVTALLTAWTVSRVLSFDAGHAGGLVAGDSVATRRQLHQQACWYPVVDDESMPVVDEGCPGEQATQCLDISLGSARAEPLAMDCRQRIGCVSQIPITDNYNGEGGNSMMRAIALVMGTTFFACAANAATLSLDAWYTDNIIAEPFSVGQASGTLTGVTTLTGNVSLHSSHFYGIDYTATWSLDFLSQTLTASSVSCQMAAGAVENACLGTGPNLIGPVFLGEGSVTPVQLAAIGAGTVVTWQTTDNLWSSYRFHLSDAAVVPLPAAGWLFISSFGALLGMRTRKPV